MLVGKTGHGPSCKQDEINALMVALAKAGKRVVRLKGGDPMIFGRAGEEIAACREAGIAVEVVPGITAAQGAAARLGVSLTHRARRAARAIRHRPRRERPPAAGHSTGRASPIRPPPPSSTCRRRRSASWPRARWPRPRSRDAGGRGRAATRPDETVVAGTVADIGAKLAAAALPSPVLVLIGRVFEGVAVNDIRVGVSSPSAPRAAQAFQRSG